MDRRLPTLSDVARSAGVSYATADRVVNDRGGVAEKSVRRVRTAIAELGYVRNVAAANLSQQRVYRFAFVIPTGSNSFFRRLRSILAEAGTRMSLDRVQLRILDVAAFDADALARCLAQFDPSDTDGICLVGIDDPRVRTAIDRLTETGIAVTTLVSDVAGSGRNAYFGIDNVVAGQTAGRLIALAHSGRGGRVLPVVGSLSARDHAERLDGMRRVISAAAPALESCPEIEGFDRHEQVETLVRAALAADPGITAIYSAGAGNAGLVRVMETLPAGRERPVVVLHELVDDSRRALERGLVDVVIDQRPEDEIALAFTTLRRIVDRMDFYPPDVIAPTIYVKDNLPPAPTGHGT